MMKMMKIRKVEILTLKIEKKVIIRYFLAKKLQLFYKNPLSKFVHVI